MANKPMVLVVEDERPLMEAIELKLRQNGFEVVTADTVKKGLEEMAKNKVDFVWLDHYLLGQENGFDFITDMKKNKAWKDIPVFVVSNTGDLDKSHSYLALGANKYYVKAEHKLDEV